MSDLRHPAETFLRPNQIKPNYYAPKQVMDGDVLVGTIEYDYPGWVATIEATGETKWFSRVDPARQWVYDTRGEMSYQDKLESDLSIRFQWHGYAGDY